MMTVVLGALVIGYIAICIFLLFFILMQSGKGGGLSGLASSNPLSDSLGVAGSEKTLTKWTTYCTIAFFIITLAITFFGAQKQRRSSSLLGNLPANTSTQTTQVQQQKPFIENPKPTAVQTEQISQEKNPPASEAVQSVNQESAEASKSKDEAVAAEQNKDKPKDEANPSSK